MSIARNTAYNLIGSAFPLVVSLVTVPIYLRVIGLERYGLLAICWVLLGYMEVFGFGLGPATAQHIAQQRNRETNARAQTFWGSLFLSLMLGTAGALLLLVFASPVLHVVMDRKSQFAYEVADAITWLSLLAPLTTSYSVVAGALQGRQEFLLFNLINGLGSAALAVAPLVAAFFFGVELRTLVIALVFVRAATVTTLMIACRVAIPLGRPKLPSPDVLKSLLTFGGWVTGEALLAPILLSAEKLAVGWLRTAATVSVYMIPFNILSRILLLPQSLAAALIPRFAGIAPAEVEEIARDALRNLCLLTTPLVLIALLALKPFLQIWIGSSLAAASAPVGILLIPGFWFNACAHVPYASLIGRGRPDLVVKMVAIQLGPYIALLYFGIESAGLTGAALVWSIRALVELFLFSAVTREFASLIKVIFLPALMVLAAATVDYLAPFPSIAGTLIISSLLIISVIRSWRSILWTTPLSLGWSAKEGLVTMEVGSTPSTDRATGE